MTEDENPIASFLEGMMEDDIERDLVKMIMQDLDQERMLELLMKKFHKGEKND